MKIREDSLVEKLPYWDIRDGIMFLADGRMEIGVEVNPPPTLFYNRFNYEQLALHIKATLRNAIDEKQRLRMILEVSKSTGTEIREYANELNTGNRMLETLANKRTQTHENYRNKGELNNWKLYFTLTLGKKFRQKYNSLSKKELDERILFAKKARQKLMNFLEMTGFQAKPMTTNEVFGLTFRFLNPGLRTEKTSYQNTWQNYPTKAIKKIKELAPPTLRTQLAKTEIDNSQYTTLGFGPKYAKILALETTPDETSLGMINQLLDMEKEFWLIVDFSHEPHQKAVRALKGRARRFSSAANTTDIHIDQTTYVGLEETNSVLEYIARAGDHVFRVGAALVVIDNDRDELSQRLDQAFSISASIPGNPFRPLNFGVFTTYFTLLPFSGNTNDQTVSVMETNAAHFLPTRFPWPGSDRPVMLFQNRWKSTTKIDPFDPKSISWNGIIIGSTGSGKTFLTQYMLTEMLRNDDTEVIIVDRGRGYEPMIEALGGSMVEIEAGGRTGINPFDLEPGEMEPSEQKKQFLYALIRTMAPKEKNGAQESLEDAIIRSAIEQVYTRAKTEKWDEEGKLYDTIETVFLSDLIRTLKSIERIGNQTASRKDKEIAEDLATRLQNWTGKTPYGKIVDRPTTFETNNRLTYYETSGLGDDTTLQGVAILMIADIIWRHVKKDPGKRKVVVFDEAWALLQVKEAADFIVELYRRFRRYNAAVWSVTQSLTDFKTEATRGILQNTTYHYLLRLDGEEDLLKEYLGLTDTAIDTFKSLKGKKGVYSEALAWIRKENGLEGDVIWVVPSEIDYWTFTTNALDMKRRNQELAKTQGDYVRAILRLADIEDTETINLKK